MLLGSVMGLVPCCPTHMPSGVFGGSVSWVGAGARGTCLSPQKTRSWLLGWTAAGGCLFVSGLLLKWRIAIPICSPLLVVIR